MRTLRLILPVATLVAAFLATSGISSAKPEYSKTEKKPCLTCHVKTGSKDLNDVGKYYKEHKKLDGAPKPK